MLRSILRLLLRFRWPVMVALVVFLVLYNVMQPRPVSVYRLPVVEDMSSYGFKVSPSGEYVAVFDRRGTNFHLCHLPTKQTLFSHSVAEHSSLGFDASDGLSFVTVRSDTEKDEQWLEWCHWQPGQPQPVTLGERLIEPDWIDIIGSMPPDNFMGLRSFDGKHCRYRSHLLSPDGRTWLMLRGTAKDFLVDLIDARTGKTRSTLEKLVLEKHKRDIYSLDVAFSPDSQTILLQKTVLQFEHAEGRAWISRYDLRTGNLISADVRERPYRFELVLCFDREQIVALKHCKQFVGLQKYDIHRGYSLIPLTETIPERVEHLAEGSGERIRHHFVNDTLFHVTDGKVTFSWKSGSDDWSDMSQEDFNYSVRDIATGQLVHSKRYAASTIEDQDRPRPWSLLAMLPEQSIVLAEPDPPVPYWKQLLENWRNKYAPWIPIPVSSDIRRLHFIDGKTATCLHKITFNGSCAMEYHAPTQSLYAMQVSSEECQVQRFAYPLWKPWLHLFGWSSATLFGLMLLQVTWARVFKRRQSRVA